MICIQYEYHYCDYSCINDSDGNGICDEVQGSVQDIDGNMYNTVIIGDQIWMAENLKVTRYNNGDTLHVGICECPWGAGSYGCGCDEAYEGIGAWDFNGDPIIYGNLYNWYAVDDERGICPENYRIPTESDFDLLFEYVGYSPLIKFKLTSPGTLEEGDGLWANSYGGSGNNLSGFSIIPAGVIGPNTIPLNLELGYSALVWTSDDQAVDRSLGLVLYYYLSYLSSSPKALGASIRCLAN